MAARQQNSKTDQDILNVFILDGSASMLQGKLPYQTYSRFDQGHEAARLLGKTDVTLFTASGECALVLRKDSRALLVGLSRGGPPNAKAAQEITQMIQSTHGANKTVNIVYLTDETSKQMPSETKEFLQELKKNTASVYVMAFKRGSNVGINEKTEEEGISFLTVSDNLNSYVISLMIEGIWKRANASPVNQEFNKRRLHGNTALTQARQEICDDLAKKTAAAKKLEAEIENKKKQLAAQKRDILGVKKQLEKIDNAMKVIQSRGGKAAKRKRPSGPSHKK